MNSKAMDNDEYIGVIVCKLDKYKETMRGYIGLDSFNLEYNSFNKLNV